jgi:hypothetical protein
MKLTAAPALPPGNVADNDCAKKSTPLGWCRPLAARICGRCLLPTLF